MNTCLCALGPASPFAAGAAPRADAIYVWAALKLAGVEVVMTTDEVNAAADAVVPTLGITTAMSDVPPHGKWSRIDRLHKAGKHVTMVGDSVNDALALGLVCIGVAIGAGFDAVVDAGDAILLRRELCAAVCTGGLSHTGNRTVVQNPRWQLVTT